jgi:hypothetical protein
MIVLVGDTNMFDRIVQLVVCQRAATVRVRRTLMENLLQAMAR